MNDLLKRLNMEEISPLFDECYEKVRDDESIPDWLTEEFIKKAHSVYSILPTQLDTLLTQREKIAKNDDLVMFAKVLYEMLSLDADGRVIFADLAFPETPDGKNLVGVFPMLAHFVRVYSELKDMGIPEEILQNTFRMLDLYLSETAQKRGYAIFPVGGFVWTNLAKSKCLFRIDRLNLEIRNDFIGAYGLKNANGDIKILMKDGTPISESGFYAHSNAAFLTEFTETDECFSGNEVDNSTATVKKEIIKLSKSQWSLFYKPGDYIVSIHIPTKGTFEPEVVESALSKGKEFLNKYFPHIRPTAYFCFSWLLAPELSLFLKPTSNILNFQNRFYKFPYKEYTEKDVFTYVFHVAMPKTLKEYDFSSLPEDNSLQKKIKDYYISGKTVHESSGFFPY